jgi:hypothetical protein
LIAGSQREGYDFMLGLWNYWSLSEEQAFNWLRDQANYQTAAKLFPHIAQRRGPRGI